MVMTPNELRMVLQETGASAHYDLGSPRKVAGDLLILHHTATDAADAWEAEIVARAAEYARLNFALDVSQSYGAHLRKRLEAANRLLDRCMGYLEGDDELRKAVYAALAGEE